MAAAIFLLGLALGSTASSDPVNVTGRWSTTSPSALSSNGDKTATGIHMAWLRGDDDWAVPGSGHFHSYLFWWNNRDEFCIVPQQPDPNLNPKFKGALYGWNPGGNPDNTGTMMSSGFTRIQLNDADLDPGGEANGHDIFCAGHTLLHSGALMVAGGSDAENTGSFKTAIFDPHVTSGSRWTQMGNLTKPRWYPTLVQTSSGIFSYAGLQYARMHVLFGKPASGGEPRAVLGRHRVTSYGSWDDDLLPAADAGAAAGNPDGSRPLPRYHAAGGAYRVPHTAITRTVMFGGRDNTQGWSGPGGEAVRKDVWWLEHDGTDGADAIKWVRFNTYTGDNQPTLGLWKHAAVVNENTADLWVFGGLDGNGNVNSAVFHGRQDLLVPGGREWTWLRYLPANAPPARVLASSAYDEGGNRMIVYGGYTDAAGTTVTGDSDVYALSLGPNPTWQKLTCTSTERPAALAEGALAAGPYGDEHHLDDGPKANMYLYGGASSSGLTGDVWLMYFPSATTVRWVKLNISGPAGPGLRKGARAIRDHDSWNLRVFGGVGPSGATDGNVHRIDIYRDPTKPMCDAIARQWVTQYGAAHPDGGTTGSIVVFDPYEVPANTIEWRQPGTAANSPWTQVPGSGDRFQHFYPLLFPLPDGKVFDATARLNGRSTFRFDPGNGQWEQFPTWSATPLTPLASLEGGSAVMRRLVDGTYDIMKCGTKDTEASDAPAHGITGRLRLNAAGTAPLVPGTGWTEAGAMLPRVFHNLVTLPGGQVMVTGGVSVNSQGLERTTPFAVKQPQIWDPSSGTWTAPGVLAAEELLRGYHGACLLMPDGRVVTGGGNDPTIEVEPPALPIPDEKHQFAVYAPPKWFDATGSVHAAGPTLLTIPRQVGYNATLMVEVASYGTVERVVLIRPGAVTHGFNSS